MELLFVRRVWHVGYMLNRGDKELEFLDQMSHRFDEGVVLRLLHEVVDAEAAADDVEE